MCAAGAGDFQSRDGVDVGFVLAALPPSLRHKLAVAMEGERMWAMRYPPLERISSAASSIRLRISGSRTLQRISACQS